MFQNNHDKTPAEAFWLRLMNKNVQKEFLKSKEKQENECIQQLTF